MNVTNKFLLILCFLVLQASSSYGCVELYKIIGEFQYHQRPMQNICYLSVHPRNDTNMLYRDYIFSSEGTLMVFNSYGEGDESGLTGARVYMFFPRGIGPTMNIKNNGVEINSFHQGMRFIFSLTERKMIHSEGFSFVEEEVRPDNHGGFHIANQLGLMLDSGFNLGGDPRLNKKRKSIFKNAKNQTCEVLNKKIFSYENDEVQFKFSDEQLSSFLRQQCPQFITEE